MPRPSPIPLLAGLAACAPLPPGEVDVPPCEEIVDTLRPGQRTPFGTTANQARVRLGGTHAVRLTGPEPVEATLTVMWPAGLEALVWGAPSVEPDPAPPGWCADGLDIPGGLRFQAADAGLDRTLRGRLRVVGPIDDIVGHLVAAVPGPEAPELLPDGADADALEVVLWASWADGAVPAGTVRTRPLGADPLDAGSVVADFGP